MTDILFADDADAIEIIRQHWEAADNAHTAASIAFRCAQTNLRRSRSAKRLAAYEAADAALETAAADLRAADQSYRRAVILANRRIAQAIRAARAVANGVQLQLSL